MLVNKALFLLGPTAVGKTELALRLSTQLAVEIVSVDSALIYRDLNIGSAKPTQAELKQVPHHLIDILSPLENYSVADFLRAANQCIADINARNKIPLLVGGTMMYFNALIKGISQLPSADPILRQKLSQELCVQGNSALFQRLQEIDPESAAKISENDSQRLLRALEVCILSGTKLSQAQAASHIPGLINCEFLALAIVPENRQLLHERINQRFAKMLDLGFVEEVQQLRRKYPDLNSGCNSMRCVGYRQVWEYLAGSLEYSELLTQGQAATRQLAKRQITWLRSLPVVAIDDPQLDLTRLQAKIWAQISEFVGT